MEHQDKGIKVPLLFSHTQTRQEVMTASWSPCYSSGGGRVTKKPPETAPNPAWVMSGRPSGTGTTMHESSRRTQREGVRERIFWAEKQHMQKGLDLS